ncbi:MAG TPA: hypothetical protein VMZ91_15065 [Candidatus Paceibacterota bacterium]|nr:hypothetical protein [Candidatus Paceibacterota bacterium]
MRFKEYITEVKEVNLINKMVGSLAKQLYPLFKKEKWVLNDEKLLKLLNKAYGQFDIKIKFFISSDKTSMYRNISYAEVSIDYKQIEVYITKGSSEFFKRFAKPDKEKMFLDIRKNEFFSDLANILIHEIRHFYQIIMDPNTISIDPGEPGVKHWEYLETKSEIDAFALQGAVEFLKLGKPGKIMNMYKDYFEKDAKEYKKFLSKVERYKKKMKTIGLDKVF